MKLPFQQFPELPEGHGLLVGAPTATGKTAFLARLAKYALDQDLDVCFLTAQDGSVWLWELVQGGHKKLTFVDLNGVDFTPDGLMRGLVAGLHAKVLIIDDWDSLIVTALRRRPLSTAAPIGFLAKALKYTLKEVEKQKSYAVFGINSQRNGEQPTKPVDADAWVWDPFFRLYPIPFIPPSMISGLPETNNLKVINLIRERM